MGHTVDAKKVSETLAGFLYKNQQYVCHSVIHRGWVTA